jgi:hypothetical protein
MSSPRQIVEGQLIHESAFECGDYIPKAAFPPGKGYQWSLAQLREQGKIEDDPYASIRVIMERLESQTALSPLQLNRLAALRLSGDCRLCSRTDYRISYLSEVERRSITSHPGSSDVLFEAFRRESCKQERDSRLLTSIILALAAFTSLPPDVGRRKASSLRKLLSIMAHDAEYIVRNAVSTIIGVFGDSTWSIYG